MTNIREILENLRDTDEAAAVLRKTLEDGPSDEIVRINLDAIEKRRSDLVRRLDFNLAVRQEDLVRYRIVRSWSSAYPAKAVAASILAFQDLVTAIFDALRTAPKRRYRPSPENVELSTLDFSGASAGSVLVALSIPNERLLLSESDLDRSFALVRRVLMSRSKEEFRQLVEQVGVASLSKAYAWADTSATYGLDALVMWGKKFDDTSALEVTRAEAQVIKDLIQETSDEFEEQFEIEGTLVGFDADTSYFHLKTDQQDDIRGDLTKGLSRQWTTDLRYRARLLKTTILQYATGEEKVAWTLLSLELRSDDAEEHA